MKPSTLVQSRVGVTCDRCHQRGDSVRSRRSYVLSERPPASTEDDSGATTTNAGGPTVTVHDSALSATITGPAATDLESSSSTTLTSEGPTFAVSASDVDRWINGDVGGGAPIETAVRSDRTPRPTTQRATMAREQLFPGLSNFWCTLAMLVPLAGARPRTPHTVPVFPRLSNPISYGLATTICNIMHTSENFLTQVNTVCNRVRTNMRRLAEEQAQRDLFATFMDVVLVLYAFAFLIQSMYRSTYVG